LSLNVFKEKAKLNIVTNSVTRGKLNVLHAKLERENKSLHIIAEKGRETIWKSALSKQEEYIFFEG
jgi:hypothetical protein